MKESDNGYHISFFKPTTERARFNRNLVVWLASIWFIAIFGFMILLRVVEKPTPEPVYVDFQSCWEQVTNNTAGEDDYQKLGQATLSVLGKIAITAEERQILAGAMSHSIYQMFPDSIQPLLVEKIAEFETLKASITDIADQEYVDTKRKLSAKLSPKLGLGELDARTQILPIELTTEGIESLSDETLAGLPEIMEKYLIHNESFLTKGRILGFPFHYFYTAIFLLVLFVGLCWLYCVRTDRRNVILGIED